jgi:short-subunit dehydrogenase
MTEVALVTGASSGIGEAFARALAQRGYELILVARREDRLRELAAELPGPAHPIQCDLATEVAVLRARVAELDLTVDLLVNNAGLGSYGRFLDADPERDAQQVRVNCEAIVALTHTFLPGMVERGGGGVITVASTAGMQPLPYEAVYSATKAFARTFSDALHRELRGTDVRVLAVNPGPVPTEFQPLAGQTDESRPRGVPGKISAEQVVEEALAAYERGRRSIIPGRVIRWFIRASGPLPTGLKLWRAEQMYRPRGRR